MVVLRHEIGDVLRDVRQRQGRTLREVSHSARVSLGYLSEVERGQKEASSELLSSICSALDVPLSLMLREVSDRLAEAELLQAPGHRDDGAVIEAGVLLVGPDLLRRPQLDLHRSRSPRACSPSRRRSASYARWSGCSFS